MLDSDDEEGLVLGEDLNLNAAGGELKPALSKRPWMPWMPLKMRSNLRT